MEKQCMQVKNLTINNMLVTIMKFRQEYGFQEEHKDNEFYHHSRKGCEVDMRCDTEFTLTADRAMEYSYCKTHNCFCSKSGWLFHHNLGIDSLALNEKKVRCKCKVCHEWFRDSIKTKYHICPNCINISKEQ